MIEWTKQLMDNQGKWRDRKPDTSYIQEQIVHEINKELHPKAKQGGAKQPHKPDQAETTSPSTQPPNQEPATVSTEQPIPPRSTRKRRLAQTPETCTQPAIQEEPKHRSTKRRRQALASQQQQTQMNQTSTQHTVAEEEEEKPETPEEDPLQWLEQLNEEYKQNRKHHNKNTWSDTLAEESTIKIASNNIRGGAGIIVQDGKKNTKMGEIWEWMTKEKVDILMTQECKMQREEERTEEWSKYTPRGSKVYVAAPESATREKGVMIMLGRRLAPLVRESMIIRDEAGRFLAVPIRTLVKGIHIWVISIYAPHSKEEKAAFWQETIPQLMQKVKMNSSTRDMVLVGTDTNQVIDPEIDWEWQAIEEDKRAAKLKEKQKEAERVKGWMEMDDLVDIWRQKNSKSTEYTWGHINRQNYEAKKSAGVEPQHKPTTCRRIDIMMINKAYQGAVTSSKILTEETIPWQTDHKGVVSKIAGMKVLRKEEKRTWQRPTYKTNKLNPSSIARIENQIDRWDTVGGTGAGRMAKFTQAVQKAMKKHLGQKESTTCTPSVQPKSSLSKEIHEQIQIIRKLMAEQNHEERADWAEQEILRCQHKDKKNRTSSEQQVSEMEVVDKQTITWMLRHRWEHLKTEVRREEEKLLLAKWKARAEVKQIGQQYTPWATHFWRQGKIFRQKEPGILVLQDPETEEFTVGEAKRSIMTRYMQSMWGNKNPLPNIQLAPGTRATDIGNTLNSSITIEELRRAIKKLKKTQSTRGGPHTK